MIVGKFVQKKQEFAGTKLPWICSRFKILMDVDRVGIALTMSCLAVLNF